MRQLPPAHAWCNCGKASIADCTGYRVQRTPLLTVTERDQVYALQVALHAVKACDRCGQVLPVDLFDGYGAPRCCPCLSQRISDSRSAAGHHSHTPSSRLLRRVWRAGRVVA